MRRKANNVHRAGRARRRVAAAAAALGLLVGGVCWAFTPTVDDAPPKLREGTRVSDERGAIAIAGDRLVFDAQNGAQFILLENLNLQRVARVLANNPHAQNWVVSGLATEYQGGNYLLLSRAILRSAAAAESQASNRTARRATAAP